MGRSLAGVDVSRLALSIVAKDGRRVFLDLTGRLVTENDVPVRFEAIARDVTEQRQLGEQLAHQAFHDPLTQFLSRDPLASLTGEVYAYGGGDPLNALDLLGLGSFLGIPLPNVSVPNVPNPLNGLKSGVSHLWHAAAGAVQSGLGGTSREFGSLYGFLRTAYTFAIKNRGLLFSGGALATCLFPGVGLVGCGIAAGVALVIRAEQRIQDRGWRSSLTANLVDMGLSFATFGVLGIPSAVAFGDTPEAVSQLLRADAVFTGWQTYIAKIWLAGPDIGFLMVDALESAQSCPP